MADGIRSTLIPAGTGVDEFLANQAISGVKKTVRVPRASVVDQITQDISDTLTDIINQSIAQNDKDAVVVASTGNVVIASGLVNGVTLNGVVLATGDRVLLKAQTAPAENGAYVVAASGAASRATDADSPAELLFASFYVKGGTVDAFTTWVCATNPITTLGTTPLKFVLRGSSETNVRSDVGTNPAGLGVAPTVFDQLTAFRRSFAAVPTSRNLFNPDNAGIQFGHNYQVDGTIASNAAFAITGKIPTPTPDAYVFTLFYADPTFYITQEVFYWNADGSFHSHHLAGDTISFVSEGNGFCTALVVPPSGAAYSSFSVSKLGAAPTSYDFDAAFRRAMLSDGFDRKAFEAYAPANAVSALTPTPGLTVIKAYPYLYIRDQFKSGLDKVEVFSVSTPAYRDYSVAGMAGPIRVHLIGSGTPAEGTVAACAAFTGGMIALTADDGVPIWVNGLALGGNHGWPSLQITATAHGKTNADVGSKWADGASKDWRLVRIIDANTLMIAPYPGGTSTQWTVNTTLTGSTLTHVGGATHTGSISLSAPVASQLYPWAQRQTVQIFLDGKEFLSDGVYRGEHLQVAQSYGVPNPKAVLDNLFSVVGSLADPSYNYTAIQTQVEVEVAFSWRPGELCVVTYDWYNVQDYLQIQVSGIQFGPLVYAGSDEFHLFVPRSSTESTTGLDFSTNPNITSNATLFEVGAAEWTDGTDPPEHFATSVKTALGYDSRGCLFGYCHLVDRGVPATRAASTDVACQVSAGNKVYPFAVNSHLGSVATVAAHYSVVAYRGYFDAGDSNIVCQGIYSWGGKKYWVFDTLATLTNVWIAPRLGALAQIVGKSVSVTGNGKKSSGLTFKSSFVSQKGVLISTSAGGGSFIAEIG